MATVIKAPEAEFDPAGRVHLSRLELADHLAEAREVVQSAKRSAQQILDEAHAERVQVIAETRQAAYEAAYARGHDEGIQAGREAAYQDAVANFRQEQGQLITAMHECVAQVNAVKEDLFIAAERDVLELAVRLAAKLTFGIGMLYRQAAIANLERALHLVGKQSNVLVRVHPDDLKAMQDFAAELPTAFRRGERRAVEVHPDDTIAPGGCKVETPTVDVDATLETQLDEIVSLLLGQPSGPGSTGPGAGIPVAAPNDPAVEPSSSIDRVGQSSSFVPSTESDGPGLATSGEGTTDA